ncbi:MAG: yhgF, partial [Firmicutes bacterium]|nr:yhgF [Bacillota bacterium]
MLLTEIPLIIARELGVKPAQVSATTTLLDDGNTVPFISRYRKEATGELNEEQIRTIEERCTYLRNLVKRQEEIISIISEQGKLTPELEASINAAVKLQELEDLYLPFRPKKRTRAQIAREKGLEPLAEIMLAQTMLTGDAAQVAAEYINPEKEVQSADIALAGAMDIIAETISERADIRVLLRKELWLSGEIATELAVSETEGQAFLNYREYREPIKRMPSHRILAVNRGERKNILKVSLLSPHENNIALVTRQIIQNTSIF